jgi:transposase-like protein
MHTMALDQSALLELLDTLKAANGDDVVRRSLEAVFQALIEAEATAAIGAEPHQRAETRVAQRNGYRDRLVTTAAGDVELRIPKLRAGSFFPSLLERRRRIDQVLFAVVMEAYVTGTSTRKVDNLVVAMGADTGSPRVRSLGSAPTSTSRWRRSGTGRWPRSRSRMCSSTPPSARPGSVVTGAAGAAG